MYFSPLLSLATLASAAPQLGGGGSRGGGSVLRFGCGRVVVERLDPLVQPGSIPSAHMHQVIGGDAFNASMPGTDISELASCTTCTFTDDLSNYWTANLYFRAKNGTFMRVPQKPNRFMDGENEGATVYYISSGKGKATAFKPGFRMLTGDASRKESPGYKRTQSCFRCYSGPNFKGDDYAPCSDPRVDTEGLPTKKCYGIRSSVHYPTCWDGKTLDSANHQDHISYPEGGPDGFGIPTGKCPDTHPVKLPQISLEIVWNTELFNDLWDEADGEQPFYLSTGDNTGYAQHGDYVFGWKGDALQKAMDSACFGPTCTGLPTQTFDEANKCKVVDSVGEPVDGWLDALPTSMPLRK